MSNELIKVKHDWRSFAVGMQIISIIQIVVYFVVEGKPAILVVGLLALPFLFLFSILIIKFIDFATPVALERGGVQCYTGLGVKTSVRWKDVQSTQYITFWPGLRWIFLNDGRKIFKRACIPVFIQDRGRFYEEVVKSVGEDHAVAKTLRKNGFEST